VILAGLAVLAIWGAGLSRTALAGTPGGFTYTTPDYVYPTDSGYYNVKDARFKCFGDGKHDDTSCIKSAMNAAMRIQATAGRHATVYFPAGTYLVTDSLVWATYGNDDAVITAKVDASRGCITSFTIARGGSGYDRSFARNGESNPGPSLFLTGGGGSGAEFYTRLGANGSIIGIQPGLGNLGSPTCAGHGYSSPPTVRALNWKAYLRFEGQNKSRTVIKLADRSPLFQNANCNVSPHGDKDAQEYCRAVIMTGNDLASNSIGIGETGYENDIWNLTVDTGSGNPGAVAIDWVGSNRASLKNVDITSGDGRSRCGLSVARSSSAGTGPAYVKNVSIEGFDYGIYANAAARGVGNTFEFIDLSRIRIAGVVNGDMPNWFRKISADIQVPVFVNQGKGSLLVTDGNFINGSPNETAIHVPATATGGVVFLRNIDARGYAAALATGPPLTVIPGSHIGEYAFPEPTSQFPTNLASLNLPDIPNTPEYIDNDFKNWASVSAYGPACRPNSGQDATGCIQAALNSGKPVIYFPFGNYWASSTLHIPSGVHAVLGMNSFLSSAVRPGAYPNGDKNHRASYCTIQFDASGPHPVEFRNFSFFQATQNNTFCYNGSAPMVLADILGAINVSNTNHGTGTVFLENVAIPNASYNLLPNQRVYARQYDVESGTQVHVALTGGTWWVFGFKSEGSGLLWNVNDATFELLGTFALAQGGLSSDPAFKMTRSTFSLAGISTTSGGWAIAVSEAGEQEARNQQVNGKWIGGIGYGLYAGKR
jgi:hypothetical protein